MKIGELATASSTPIETIRHYERTGLLPEPSRTRGNFRLYETQHVQRLQFIRHCRRLDMPLYEIRALLRFKDTSSPDAGLEETLQKHICEVSVRITELRALEKQLKQLLRRRVRL